MSDLRSKLIRLAHEKPELRADLLPILKEAVQSKWLSDVPIAQIHASPTYVATPDKVYPQTNRREKWQSVELANNSKALGYAKAVVNGNRTNVIYFRATNGSAEGIAWDTGMNVYRITDPELSARLPLGELGQLWLADMSRKGLRVQGSGDVVRRIKNVKTNFETVENAHRTELEILLDLNTTESLPESFFDEWLRQNWRAVVSKAPSRTPSSTPASYDPDDPLEYDPERPKPGLDWTAPKEMSFEYLDEGVDGDSPVWVNQRGNQVRLIVQQTRIR